MIKSILSNEILSRIVSIERLCERFVGIRIPVALTNRLRKNSMKKKSSASTRIEGNPLSEEQASEAIESSKRHFLKPEQEVRNYFDALQELEIARQKKELRREPCTEQISEPYHRQISGIAFAVVRDIAYLPREKVKAECAYREQSDGEKQRTENF